MKPFYIFLLKNSNPQCIKKSLLIIVDNKLASCENFYYYAPLLKHTLTLWVDQQQDQQN